MFRIIKDRQAVSWALYDFANSGYTVIIFSLVFPIFFKEVIAAGRLADFWWGFAVSVSVLIGGLLAPFIGAMADADNRRKSKLILFALLAMIGTAMLYFTQPGLILLALLIFIPTNVCFEIAQT